MLLPPTFNFLSSVEFTVFATSPILYIDDVRYRTTNVTDAAGGLSGIVHGHETSQSELRMRIELREMSDGVSM